MIVMVYLSVCQKSPRLRNVFRKEGDIQLHSFLGKKTGLTAQNTEWNTPTLDILNFSFIKRREELNQPSNPFSTLIKKDKVLNIKNLCILLKCSVQLICSLSQVSWLTISLFSKSNGIAKQTFNCARMFFIRKVEYL